MDLNAPGRTLRIGGRPLPVVGPARMYVCGITPYDATHLGHARSFVWADVAVRVLRHAGGEVRVCRNVTDVDDVLYQAAARAGSPYDRFAAVHQFYFERDLEALCVHAVDHQPRAHTHVREVIALAQGLLGVRPRLRPGRAVYFRGGDVPRRVGIDDSRAHEMMTEYGDEPGSPGKEHPFDVAVWRPSRSGEPAWPSPWGPGRPAGTPSAPRWPWRCSGPRSTCTPAAPTCASPTTPTKAALAEALTGVRPFSRAWLHVGMVLRDGVKMAKSAGQPGPGVRPGPRPPGRRRPAHADLRPLAGRLGLRARRPRRRRARLDALRAAAGRPASSAAAEAAATRALLDDLDVPAALSIAEEEGGGTARMVMRVLALG